MAKTKIEWTESTWNPITGCTKISSGCKFCYAEIMARRLKAMGQEKYKNGFDLTLHPQTLKEPYLWKKSKMIFVNSMSDLFHKDVPISFIQKIFQVMNENPQHIFQILTKRADVLNYYDSKGWLQWTNNIWMGVTVEDNTVVNRIDLLRDTRAKVKFLSCEPLLTALPNLNLHNVDWLIVGGESGRTPRPIKEEWVLQIQKQCTEQGVAFILSNGAELIRRKVDVC